MLQKSRSAAAAAPNKESHPHSSRSFSEDIFELDWTEYFPCLLGGEDAVERVDYQTAVQFILAHQTETFEQERWGHRFFNDQGSPAKQRYYERVADHFLFKQKGLPVGLVVGTLIDGHSYYLRYGMVLRNFQNGGRIQNFVNHLCAILKKHGVHRVETDVAPSNLVNVHLFNKLQFNISGLSLSDRWGTLIHFTKILNEEAEIIFLNQFCAGPRPQMEKARPALVLVNNKPGG